MTSSIAPANRKATPLPVPSTAGSSRRRLLWGISALLALILASLLALAFSLGADAPATATIRPGVASPAMPALPAGGALPTADSAEMIVDRPPGPPPRIINGMAVDADGNSLDPNLTRPADDADEDKNDSTDDKAGS